MESVTCTAPSNIAVIKYWGKRDEELLTPINDSISVTLDQMFAKTTISICPTYTASVLVLNGKEEPFDTPRINNLMQHFRQVARDSGKFNDCPEKLEWKLRVVSENNFPTAAGLASSAAGYSCLVYTLATLYGLQNDIELSSLARMGSGSACRSVYGGFVQWQRGEAADGHDSIAVQLAPASHWPELELLILVVNDARKKTSSTSGMSRSVATSPLLKHRAAVVVPQRIEEMKRAVAEKSFNKFAELAMQDSNQFHSVCLDTYPPCVYLNDVSHAVINAVHSYNAAWASAVGDDCPTKAGYTFDAGPNACILILKENVPHFVDYLKRVFPSSSTDEAFLTGIPTECGQLPEAVASKLDLEPVGTDLLKYVIHTRIGDGPQRV